jgi:uncharacterized sulfatase
MTPLPPHSLACRALLSLALLWAIRAPLGAAETPRPNILLVLADDQTGSDSGAYGNRQVPTPSIDRLAREGMRFDAAFTSTAMCAPSRQQLYTGLYPVRSGAYPNHAWVERGTRSIVHSFQELGYRVGLTGKSHVGPPESFPFEVVGDAKDGDLTEPDVEAAAKFMRRGRRQPFLLVVAANSPHEPWTHGDASAFDRASLAVPRHLADTAETRDALARYYAEITHFDRQLGAVLEALERSGKANETLVLYTSEQGASLPFAKWTLYDAGIKTALIVRWPGRVAAGTATKAMVAYVDVLPTLLAAAGATAPAGLDGRSFLDVLLGKTERHRDHVFGVHTNLGIIAGNTYPIRAVRSARHKLIVNIASSNEYANVLTAPRGRAVLDSWRRAGRAGDAHAKERYQRYLHRPRVELYDLENDPFELRNLADDPAQLVVREELGRRLEAWMNEQGDKGFTTEREALEHMNPEILRRVERETRARGGSSGDGRRPGTAN